MHTRLSKVDLLEGFTRARMTPYQMVDTRLVEFFQDLRDNPTENLDYIPDLLEYSKDIVRFLFWREYKESKQ